MQTEFKRPPQRHARSLAFPEVLQQQPSREVRHDS